MKWEYKTFQIDLTSYFVKNVIDCDALNNYLCELGMSGWELVNMVYIGPNQVVVVMKRPLMKD